MGIARVMRPDNASDTSGTPGYMAPEVMYRQNHTHAVDYYALGVIAFECMLGRVLNLLYYYMEETLCWKIQVGNKGINTSQVGINKEE